MLSNISTGSKYLYGQRALAAIPLSTRSVPSNHLSSLRASCLFFFLCNATNEMLQVRSQVNGSE